MDSLYFWEPSFMSPAVMKDPGVVAIGSHLSEGLGRNATIIHNNPQCRPWNSPQPSPAIPSHGSLAGQANLALLELSGQSLGLAAWSSGFQDTQTLGE